MAKEINVKMELWKKAHELEAKAIDNGDKKVFYDICIEKSRLADEILGDICVEETEKATLPVEELIPRMGEKSSLADVGVRLGDDGDEA